VTKSNIFLDLGFSKEEAAVLTIKSVICLRIREYIKEANKTQAEVGEMLGLCQPDISFLIHLKWNRFTIDRLIEVATMAGIEINVSFK